MRWFKTLIRASAVVVATILLCVSATFAGGFFIVGELPIADVNDKDTAFVVSAIGCYQSENIFAKAEGLVDGKRVSLPVQLEPLGEGRFRVKRTWPEKGVWGVSVYALSATPITLQGKTFRIRDAALFLCSTDGHPELIPASAYSSPAEVKRYVKSLRLTPDITKKSSEIDKALKTASINTTTSDMVAIR